MTIRHSLAGVSLAVYAARAMSTQSAFGGLLMRGPTINYGPEDDRGQKSAAELATEIKSDFATKFDAVKGLAEKAVAEAQKGIDATAAQKEVIDNALTTMNEAKTRLDDLEQKMARNPGNPDDAAKSIGQQFVESDGFKGFEAAGFSKGARAGDMQIKATLTSATTDAAGSLGDAVNQTRLPGILPMPQRRMTVRDLLSQGRMDGSTLEYVKETGFTNSAAPVAEGALKPQSEIQYTEETATVRTIAHWMRASVQILADAPALRSIIDQRLRYGLAYVEEQQLLNGSGVGQNLEGLVTAATAYAAPGGLVAGQLIDTIRMGHLQVALAEYPANGTVLNPIDWAFIEMLKDGEGRYLIGNPQGTISPTLWGLPVVATQAMGVDKFLTGAFDLAAQIFDRQDATVEVSTEDQDNFVRNKVTIRAEERLALAIYRPEALVYGDLGRVA